MGNKKYRLKDKYKGVVALTTPSFECIIRKGEEVELTDEELRRMKDFVEPVPVARKKKTEEVRVIEEVMEEDK